MLRNLKHQVPTPFHRSWQAAIRSVRNHPCVFAYVMDNEFPETRGAEGFRSAAAILDPDRFFNVDDGVFPYEGYPLSGNAANPKYEAYIVPQFGRDEGQMKISVGGSELEIIRIFA